MPARPGLRVTLRRPQLVIAALRQRPFRSRGKLGLILYFLWSSNIRTISPLQEFRGRDIHVL
jgi:hypothetical protein